MICNDNYNNGDVDDNDKQPVKHHRDELPILLDFVRLLLLFGQLSHISGYKYQIHVDFNIYQNMSISYYLNHNVLPYIWVQISHYLDFNILQFILVWISYYLDTIWTYGWLQGNNIILFWLLYINIFLGTDIIQFGLQHISIYLGTNIIQFELQYINIYLSKHI